METVIELVNGKTYYSNLGQAEVRMYMQGGSQARTFPGYSREPDTNVILQQVEINALNICTFYERPLP